MKILFLSDVYFPRINGVSTSMQTFRHELRAQGHTVHLIAPEYLTTSADETEIWRIPAHNIPMDPEDRLMRYGVVMQQLERLRHERYDLIHIQTPFVAHYLGVRLARLLGIPCVETYHTFFEEYLYHYIPLVPRKLMRLAARRFSRHQGNNLDGMVVPSHPMHKILKDYGITTPTEVIPTGIETARFASGNRAAFRDKQGIAQDRPVLLFLGRVAHEKNIGFLLKAVACVKKEIADVLFVIAGEGPARTALEQESKSLGLSDNVQFIGYLDRDSELNDCYRAADIFIFASRTETQGLVLLEAMAQGTPVVSTAELGTLDVLKNGAGVWIAKEELVDFSEKIIRMLTDSEARNSLGAVGREYAHEWSASRQAERMTEFYSTVISSLQSAVNNKNTHKIKILKKPCDLTA
ncbi:MAG: glycosyltransferase [Gallionella sp.]|jgi:glycosyltransferase involved in cell wall biosynthesis